MKDYSDRPGFDREDGLCLKCNVGHSKLVEIGEKRFNGCTRWPECNNTELLKRGPISDLFISGDDLLEAWADAELYDKDWR